MSLSTIMRTSTLVAAALLSTACATREIGRAQDAFNAAATIESSSDARPGTLPISSQAAAQKYELALRLVSTEIVEHGDDLAKDKLLGVAYTLKALSQWRLGDLSDDLAKADAAGTTVDAALAEKRDLALGTRDRVLLKSVKGAADVVRARLSKDAYDAPDTGPKACCHSAVATLAAAVDDDGLPKDHSIRVWVALSQLRACRQWMAAVSTNSAFTPMQKADEAAVVATEWKKHAAELKPFFGEHPDLVDVVRRLGQSMGIGDDELKTLLAAAPSGATIRFSFPSAAVLPILCAP
jgi:hypothetical protein